MPSPEAQARARAHAEVMREVSPEHVVVPTTAEILDYPVSDKTGPHGAKQ